MLVTVLVKLRQPKSELQKIDDQTFIARVTSAPTDNKANNEIVLLLKKHFDVRKSSVSLVKGAKSKTKFFEL